MKYFAAIITLVENVVERRAPYREAHLAYLRGLKAEGRVVLGGAFADPVDTALIIYRGASKADVEKMIENDPYMKNGIWPKVSIREWSVAVS
jgi:hypothetical protein